MLDFLKDYWDSLFGDKVINVAELIVNMEQTNNSFHENSKTVLENMLILLDSSNSADRLVKASKQLGFEDANPKRLGYTLEQNFELIHLSMDELIDVAKKELPKMLTKRTMTIKQATILELSERLNILIQVYPKLLLYMLYRANNDKELMFKKGYKKILSTANAYQLEMKFLRKEFKSVIRDISKLSDTSLSIDKAGLRSVASANDKKLKIKTNNFLTTWTYNLGKWYVDYQIEKLELAKESKRLAELKILELKEMEENGNVSTALSKQIEYYEEKINKLNRKIEELSNVD